MDNVDLALQQSYDRFVYKPEWLVLASTTGEHIGHLIQPNRPVEMDRITALAGATAGHHERLTTEFEIGPLQYGLTIGQTGLVITAFLKTSQMLILKFAQADLSHLHDILQKLPVAIAPLEHL